MKKYAIAKIAGFLDGDLINHFGEGTDKITFIEIVQKNVITKREFNDEKIRFIKDMSSNRQNFYKMILNKIKRKEGDWVFERVLDDLEIPSKVRLTLEAQEKETQDKNKKDNKNKKDKTWSHKRIVEFSNKLAGTHPHSSLVPYDRMDFLMILKEYLNKNVVRNLNKFYKKDEEFYEQSLRKVQEKGEIQKFVEKINLSNIKGLSKKDSQSEKTYKKINFTKLSKYFAKSDALPNGKRMDVSEFVNIIGNIGLTDQFIQKYQFKAGGVRKDYDELFNEIKDKKGLEKIKEILDYFELPDSFIESKMFHDKHNDEHEDNKEYKNYKDVETGIRKQNKQQKSQTLNKKKKGINKGIVGGILGLLACVFLRD